MHRIVVLGAGYAGLAATVVLSARLKRTDGVSITLVNATDRFTERLRLHQVAAGEQVADLRLSALLAGTGVTLEYGWVTAVHPAARVVRLDDERELGYDTLVYALGGVADTTRVPGADEHAYVLDGRHDAELLARRLAHSGGSVAVCGSGLTGVEAAAEIAEQHPQATVTLLGRTEPGAALGPAARRHLRDALRRLGVRVRTGVEIVKVLPDGVALAGSETVPAETVPAGTVLWTSGVRATPLATVAGLAVDTAGRIVTDAALRSVSHPEVYAVGDAAAIEQGYGMLHGTCQSGMPTGVHAARAILAVLAGHEPPAFRFGYYHTTISLGRGDAVVQFTRPDGAPRRICLTGRLAVRYKETVSAAPWPTYGRMKRVPGTGSVWPRGGRYTR
ncbi:oxidoreductase [Actinocatenispora thailandica]|uniref:Oxidoreductase n=1 Tax=Actinocatenispora thailandica TaxID=227318 RepID=A0A7R7DJG4_9ACTN|nr:FAD-dependent oxidoreductase [Actinocatenispora thailandica]BCJ32814.1 oxidoreductase [Actinocatenispora thailandica]